MKKYHWDSFFSPLPSIRQGIGKTPHVNSYLYASILLTSGLDLDERLVLAGCGITFFNVNSKTAKGTSNLSLVDCGLVN